MTQLVSRFQEGSTPTEHPRRSPNKLKLLIPLALLALGTGLGVRYYLSLPQANSLQLSGRIEGYETDVGAKVGGRIDFVAVREGDRVTKGQAIARLDDAEIQAQLAGARARLASAQQKESQARLQLAVIDSQIKEAQLNLSQSKDDALGKINQAQAAVASAQAQLAQAKAQQQEAEAELKLAQTDRNRYLPLLKEGVIPQQQFDQTQTRLESAQASLKARRAAVAAAQKQVNVAEGALIQAQTSKLNPDINTARIEGWQKQLAQAKSQLAAAQADVKNAKASEQEILARVSDLKVLSPIDGVVITRTVEPGEVVAAGKTLLTLVNLNDVYLRGYIPEGRIGEVRVGQAAKVLLDSAPDRPLSARVTAIDPQASFTPENIYFKDDRVTQVFGVKLGIDNPGGFAKPGMPADGEILVNSQ
jgi:HlyD family secretion protein